MIKTSKQLSAFRQISAAIDHVEKKDHECAITLAGAAEGNMFIHWMKHSSVPENAEIEEQEVVTTIIRAIQKYVGAHETMHPKFQTFSDWCIAKGYTKKPLAEKKAD